MPDFSLLGSNSDLPTPGNPETAANAWDRWREALEKGSLGSLESAAGAIENDPAARHFLEGVFSHSPYLTQAATIEPATVLGAFMQGPDAILKDILAELSAVAGGDETEADLKRRLRVAKRRAALVVALADISGHWPLEKVTEGLSDLADACLQAAVRHVLREAAGRGVLEPASADDPADGSGLVILGMGKLGARELNYSSDIDLIVLFDPEAVRTDSPDGLQTGMVRLTRQLLRLIDERTADGYVFRTDLRLRPDPGATPLAMSMVAAENYYESLGQNWERAAMIKARPVAGDIAAGERFLEWLRPFVWRKNLDFAAIQDIHSIKRQINAHRGGAKIKVLGHNVKLGAGGIREIEFFAQTQQLIWGGRLPDLRLRRTKDAIDALVGLDLCPAETAADLKVSYDFLRRVEHRLQMVNDEQTHILPQDADGLASFAGFMGYGSADRFAEEVTGHLQSVERHYGGLFADAPALSAAAEGDLGGNLVFTGGEADPETLETLRRLGFTQAERVDGQVRAWHHGRYRAMRSTRARELLTELTPVLLEALSRMPDPDEAFIRFDRFLAALPSGVQLFSMFHSNPELLTLVARIIGKAPRLAQHMSTNPSVLDAVLTPDFFEDPPALATLSEEIGSALAGCRDMEDLLLLSRRWANDRKFQIGVLQLENKIRPADASAALSDIAEAAIAGLLPCVIDEFADHHGKVPGGEFAVVALGRLGSREMTAASDLDLIFVYDAPDAPGGEILMSDGAKPLAVTQYYARLTQRMINALTAPTQEGVLYEVDMRLRPSGTKGPIAASLASFRQYHAETAWTWEHLALVRARVVAASGGLGERVEAEVAAILSRPRNADQLLADTADMRRRLDREKRADSIWNVKNLRGGLVDIAFIVQYLCLRHGAETPGLRDPNTYRSLANLKDAGLLAADDADLLMRAQSLWTALLGLLALTIEGPVTLAREGEISDALAEDLARVGGADDFDELQRRVRATAEAVYRLFQKLIEHPAAALPPPATDGSPARTEETADRMGTEP